MRQCFAEVLSREKVRLKEVTDMEMLRSWRKDLVEELMNPKSSYALALRERGGVQDRVEFLERWCELIAEALDHLLPRDATDHTLYSPRLDTGANVNTQKTAVLILAALYGGGTLSFLAEDPKPLNAALDLALVPFVAT